MHPWSLLAMVTPEPPHGATLGGTLEVVALVCIVVAVVGLVLVEFVFKSRMARSTYRWTLLLGLFVLPGVALLGTTGHIRAAVVLTLVGLLMMLPILFGIRASFVGLYMLGSMLLTVSLTLYVIAVVRELRRGGAL